MRGLGYIQSSPVFFILPHIYNCPPPGNWNRVIYLERKFTNTTRLNQSQPMASLKSMTGYKIIL
jgi:hypothetical protein